MRHKRLNIVFLLTMLVVFTANAQQQPLLGHYMFDPYVINPGAAGSTERVSAFMAVRTQWQGITGAPRSGFVSVNSPFNLFGMQHGVGLSAISDAFGFRTDAGMQLGYAIRFPVGSGKMGIGVKGGFLNPVLKADEWIFPENGFQTDPGFVQAYDDFILDLDAGIFYRTDELYVGFSSTSINAPNVEFTSEGNNSAISGKDDFVRHYYLSSGYNIYLKNNSFELKPSFLIRSDSRIISFDVSAMLMYNKKVWAGVSYRNDETSYGVIFAGLELIKDLNIGFSYDIPSNKISNYTKLTTEFFVNYNFTLGGEKITQKYKSIRYL